MYLKDRADRDSKCWPAIKTIAKELGLSSSTVKRALNELCQAGLLTKESRWREHGGETSLLSRIFHHQEGKTLVLKFDKNPF